MPRLLKAQPRHRLRPYYSTVLMVLRQTVGNLGYEDTPEKRARRERRAAIRIKSLAQKLDWSDDVISAVVDELFLDDFPDCPAPLTISPPRYGAKGRLANELGLHPYYLEKTDTSRAVGGNRLPKFEDTYPHDEHGRRIKKLDKLYYVGGFRWLPDTFLDEWVPILTEYECRLATAFLWIIEPWQKKGKKTVPDPYRARWIDDDKLVEASGVPAGQWRTNASTRTTYLRDGGVMVDEKAGRPHSDSPYRRTLRSLIKIGAVNFEPRREQYSVALLFRSPPKALVDERRAQHGKHWRPSARRHSGSPNGRSTRSTVTRPVFVSDPPRVRENGLGDPPRALLTSTQRYHSYRDRSPNGELQEGVENPTGGDPENDSLRSSLRENLRTGRLAVSAKTIEALNDALIAPVRAAAVRYGFAVSDEPRSETKSRAPRLTADEARAFLHTGWWKRHRLQLAEHGTANWDVIPCPWCLSNPREDEYPCVISDEGAVKCFSEGKGWHLTQLVAHVEQSRSNQPMTNTEANHIIRMELAGERHCDGQHDSPVVGVSEP